jgi:3-dehydroquinate dehydratase I
MSGAEKADMTKLIELNGKPLGGGKQPLICAPLVGRSRDQLLAEVHIVAAKKPDLLEWRVDFFDDIADTAAVVAMAASLRQNAGGIPLLFTRRSIHEGGEPIALAESDVVELYRAVCASGHVDLVDYEMSRAAGDLQRVQQAARANAIPLIMSYHNFQETPDHDFLCQRFRQAEQLGADVAKVAVMPRNPQDVLTLLGATLQSSQQLGIPLISMSMGSYGALTRMFGWMFGSNVTFAVGASSSAPGQIAIEDLNAVLAMVQKSPA